MKMYTQAEMNAPSSAMKTLKVRDDVEESTMRSSALVPKMNEGRAYEYDAHEGAHGREDVVAVERLVEHHTAEDAGEDGRSEEENSRLGQRQRRQRKVKAGQRADAHGAAGEDPADITEGRKDT